MAAGFRLAPRYTIAGEPKRVKAWQTRATTNPQELAALIQEATQTVGHFQHRGIASESDRVCDFIVVPPKRFAIIDIDNKNGKSGSDNWLRLLDALGDDKIKPTLIVKTKSGGFHYYFRSDCDYVKSVANFAGYAGVDVRGQRGHVVLPYRVGEVDSWKAGEYLLYQGNPAEELPLFKITKLSKSYAESEEQLWLQDIKESIKKLQPVESIPAGARDSVLWDAACILYRKGVKRPEASAYMATLAEACETTDDMSVEQIKALAAQKIDRVYKHDRKIVTVIDFERELGLGGLVRIANDGPSKYFFEHENLFKLDPNCVYSKEALGDTFKAIRIVVDDGEQQKVRSGDEIFRRYVPDQTVYGLGFYPDTSVKIFKDEISRQTHYNSYDPTFIADEVPDLLKGAEDLFPAFVEFLKFLHPVKWEELLNRLAWTVQFPQLKMVSLAAYVSPTHGVGKDILCDLHGLLLGMKHYRKLNSLEELTGKFNDFSDVLLVNIAEAQMGKGLSARNKMTEFRGLLKTLTTSSSLKSERKNIQATWRASFTNFIMTANEFNPNMLEYGDRRHEIFIFPSTTKLNQDKFGRLADLSKPQNFPAGGYPKDKLATIWQGLKSLRLTKRYHIESALDDDDKQQVFDSGISPIQAWLLTELPDTFSKDFVVWYLSNFYPQRDRIRPIDEAEYFFTECKHHLNYVKNTKGSTSQRLSLTKLHRTAVADGRVVDLQRRAVPRGSPHYYQYLYTVRNHGAYDDRPADSYYDLEDQIIKFYKGRTGPITNQTEEDLHKLLLRFQMRLAKQ
jgi:hypothetical protein